MVGGGGGGGVEFLHPLYPTHRAGNGPAVFGFHRSVCTVTLNCETSAQQGDRCRHQPLNKEIPTTLEGGGRGDGETGRLGGGGGEEGARRGRGASCFL